MKLQLDKPWLPLTSDEVSKLRGYLGVYQVAGSDQRVVRIGYAGGRELFGLRSALERELARQPGGSLFRYEVNVQYQSRWRELLMLHLRDNGQVPPGNRDEPLPRLGRLG